MNAQLQLRTFTTLLLAVITITALFGLGAQAAEPAPLKVSFIDVSQGDSALIQAPDGSNILIDGGRAYTEPTIVAYLQAQGVNQIDLMVASHADSDHINGLTKILEKNILPVGQVIYNGYGAQTTPWAAFETAVASHGITPTVASFPQQLNWGPLEVFVLNPLPGQVNPDSNDASLVLLVSYQDIDFLFTGDIDTTIEATVVARGTPLSSEVLKVSHHGSDAGSGPDFLAAVQPREAVISVGPNAYGHPSAAVLQALQAIGATIWRTDLDGNIQVVSDGSTYTVYKTHWIYLPIIQYN